MSKKKHPILLLISGGSGSGKTTIANTIIQNLPADVNGMAICQDRYYFGDTKEDPSNFNYDHPTAFDWKLMRKQIKALMNNKMVNLPIYDYSTHSRKKTSESIKPADVIIVEGIYALYDDEINSLSELKIFVDTPKDESFIRRLERDVQSRGRSMESIIKQWRTTVRPMYDAFVEPLKLKADVIIPWNEYQRRGIEIIRRGLIDLHKYNKYSIDNELLSKK